MGLSWTPLLLPELLGCPRVAPKPGKGGNADRIGGPAGPPPAWPAADAADDADGGNGGVVTGPTDESR